MSLQLVLHADSAEELMTPNPVTINRHASVDEAALRLTDKGFSAMPVVDDAGAVIGVVSQTDLVREQARPQRQTQLTPDPTLRGADDPAADASGQGVVFAPSTRVEDIMNPDIFAVAPSTPSGAVIREMLERKIRRIFVVNDRSVLVGVISAADVLMRLRP